MAWHTYSGPIPTCSPFVMHIQPSICISVYPTPSIPTTSTPFFHFHLLLILKRIIPCIVRFLDVINLRSDSFSWPVYSTRHCLRNGFAWISVRNPPFQWELRRPPVTYSQTDPLPSSLSYCPSSNQQIPSNCPADGRMVGVPRRDGALDGRCN